MIYIKSQNKGQGQQIFYGRAKLRIPNLGLDILNTLSLLWLDLIRQFDFYTILICNR